MVERGDMVAVHEPFSDLAGLGETDVEGRPFDSAVALLAWLVEQTHDFNVFVKDTTGRRHHTVLADQRMLAEARHAFLIRCPEEIAASSYAVEPDMGIDAIGLELLGASKRLLSRSGVSARTRCSRRRSRQVSIPQTRSRTRLARA